MEQNDTMTRRGLAARLTAAAATVGLGAGPAQAAADPVLRDAALRGLALAGMRGDPVAQAAADRTLAQMAQTDPEGALLARLYRRLDAPPTTYHEPAPAAARDALALLHDLIAACRPVRFHYTDLQDQDSERVVLPLALVHPPQGVKLLAWCQERGDYRQFFVRAMDALTPQMGDFRAERMTLLQGLAEKERA
ncbi:WYL domain-containing protein [Paracoccus sp. (in: a-proteobacteria)]|uniref:WYL domain-containing protein n=1 Tax=Paracoccus sp. TaxID=267 RepID=UPI0026DFF7D6|nr:WYL domain-containing protein [Paracoccus sp. (in: a-proteobacteria)]MDO5648352.1 WYL domain-containing protein [Paracoccus sp. (in: a-proteobacteria)]